MRKGFGLGLFPVKNILVHHYEIASESGTHYPTGPYRQTIANRDLTALW